MGYTKPSLDQRTIYFLVLLFVMHLDFAITIFAISGGFKGMVFEEQNPILVSAIKTGNLLKLVAFSLMVTVLTGTIVAFYNVHTFFRIVAWSFLIWRFYAYMVFFLPI